MQSGFSVLSCFLSRTCLAAAASSSPGCGCHSVNHFRNPEIRHLWRGSAEVMAGQEHIRLCMTHTISENADFRQIA
jgi:hypothetical protein